MTVRQKLKMPCDSDEGANVHGILHGTAVKSERCRSLGVLTLIALIVASRAVAATIPALPKIFDTPYIAPSGRTIVVDAGGDLQGAIDRAKPGDTITLQAGVAYVGPISLPNKGAGSDWIYIRSSAIDRLPPSGVRVGPDDSQYMPKILAPKAGSSALVTANGANHYRVVGIEFSPISRQFIHSVISLGNGDRAAATLPSFITFDRCYIHSDVVVGGRRGATIDGSYIAIIDSYVAGFKEKGADTQALWAYNSPGPFKIANNYLEAAGENVMFGGADAIIPNVVPSDIEIRDNYFFKPLSWMAEPWTVKNLLEFKNAQRVLVTHNKFENNWAGGQQGFALLVTPRNQDGASPWTVTQDISFTFNLIQNVGSAFNFSAHDDIHLSQPTQRLLVRDNVIVVTGLGGAHGRIFQTLGGPADVTIDHNTAFCSSPLGNAASGMAENTPKADRFTFTNNIVEHGNYGFTGTGTGDGSGTLSTWFTNWTFNHNVAIGSRPATYPAGNFFPATIADVKFANVSGGDYHLEKRSPYKSAATDGVDIGANIDGVVGAGAATLRGSQTNAVR